MSWLILAAAYTTEERRKALVRVCLGFVNGEGEYDLAGNSTRHYCLPN